VAAGRSLRNAAAQGLPFKKPRDIVLLLPVALARREWVLAKHRYKQRFTRNHVIALAICAVKFMFGRAPNGIKKPGQNQGEPKPQLEAPTAAAGLSHWPVKVTVLANDPARPVNVEVNKKGGRK